MGAGRSRPWGWSGSTVGGHVGDVLGWPGKGSLLVQIRDAMAAGSGSLGRCCWPGRGSPWGVLLARKGVALVADLGALVMQNKDAMVAAGWGVMVVLVGRHVGCNPVLH